MNMTQICMSAIAAMALLAPILGTIASVSLYCGRMRAVVHIYPTVDGELLSSSIYLGDLDTLQFLPVEQSVERLLLARVSRSHM
jgi:hypothetical protein